MQLDDKVGNVMELAKPSFTTTTATFSVSLSAPGDKIVYDLTIKNSGKLNAKVDSIYIVPENKPDDIILYSVGGINLGDELKAGDSTHMNVTAMYNRTSGGQEQVSKKVTVYINYVQA